MGNFYRLGRPSRRQLSDAALTAALTSLLFVVVYGSSSWLTSLRTDVGTWVYPWERAIPFVPWMIVPYMSIDLLFVAAPFICSERAERRRLARRITTAILVAGAFFLALPLHYSFPRPAPQGWTAAIFAFLHGFDRPYNLFPSLHIALLALLADTYDRHARGAWRWLLRAWFVLIGLSTVLTWQHHVVDVAGGLVLGLGCLYLLPEAPVSPGTANRRVGAYYAGGAALLAAAALFVGSWGYLLLWPAVALALTAAAYFGLLGNPFRKRDGRLPFSARLIMAPVRFGHWLSLRYYQRQAAAWDTVVPGVLLGRQLTAAEAAQAVREGVTAVLDLTAEFTEAPAFRTVRYLNLPVLDLTAPNPEQLQQALDFIRRERQRGTVYVHCKIGYSRSAAVVGAYLLAAGNAASTSEAVAMLSQARPSIIVRSEVMATLRQRETVFATASTLFDTGSQRPNRLL